MTRLSWLLLGVLSGPAWAAAYHVVAVPSVSANCPKEYGYDALPYAFVRVRVQHREHTLLVICRHGQMYAKYSTEVMLRKILKLWLQSDRASYRAQVRLDRETWWAKMLCTERQHRYAQPWYR